MDKASEQKLSGLAEEIDSGSDREETRKLFRLFSTSLLFDDSGRAQLSELVNELLRMSERLQFIGMRLPGWQVPHRRRGEVRDIQRVCHVVSKELCARQGE